MAQSDAYADNDHRIEDLRTALCTAFRQSNTIVDDNKARDIFTHVTGKDPGKLNIILFVAHLGCLGSKDLFRDRGEINIILQHIVEDNAHDWIVFTNNLLPPTLRKPV